MVGAKRWAWLLLSLAWCGCYAPAFQPCEVRCTSECPNGWQCGSDGRCHELGTPLCSTLGTDAGDANPLTDSQTDGLPSDAPRDGPPVDAPIDSPAIDGPPIDGPIVLDGALGSDGALRCFEGAGVAPCDVGRAAPSDSGAGWFDRLLLRLWVERP